MCEAMGEERPSYVTVPARVHAIADFTAVHLSTGMALIGHQCLYWDRHMPSGHMLLCCDWMIGVQIMKGNVFTLHYPMRKSECLMWDCWGTP